MASRASGLRRSCRTMPLQKGCQEWFSDDLNLAYDVACPLEPEIANAPHDHDRLA
jgi:hypothetical protein